MNFGFEEHDSNAAMTGSHEDLYELEELYLKKFGVYPDMPELSAETIDHYIKEIRQALEMGKRMK